MARPKKKKVESAETAAEDGAEVEDETGVTGEQLPALEYSNQPATMKDPTAGPGHMKQWQVALLKWQEATREATTMRSIAKEYEAKEKLAQRLLRREGAAAGVRRQAQAPEEDLRASGRPGVVIVGDIFVQNKLHYAIEHYKTLSMQ